MDSTPPAPAPESAPHKPQILIVAALSGAGKSTALQVLEDLDFLTVEGLQASMLLPFIDLALQSAPDSKGLAMGMDFRRGDGLQQFYTALAGIEERGLEPILLFLEADTETMIRRYATTRRPHPLEREGLSLGQAMAEEARRLAQLRKMADLVLDTTNFSIHDLRRELQQRWGQGKAWKSNLRVNLLSFGFKYGLPDEADMVLDLRFLPNPYFDEQLRPLSGLDKEISDYVFMLDYTQDFKERLLDFLLYLLPLYEAEGRYRLTLALGCTGGRHRSVALTEILAATLTQAGYQTSVNHRDLGRG